MPDSYLSKQPVSYSLSRLDPWHSRCQRAGAGSLVTAQNKNAAINPTIYKRRLAKLIISLIFELYEASGVSDRNRLSLVSTTKGGIRSNNPEQNVALGTFEYVCESRS